LVLGISAGGVALIGALLAYLAGRASERLS
jgi:hypothetical protein